ncbi:hypothetical protein AB0M43_35935 [Longispora sp. NPDC051575]|uniref:hypothetical protein n=1 Tax=Longispora sp. NPDC051575 TaxID=3154943 RepID=UPI00342C951E
MRALRVFLVGGLAALALAACGTGDSPTTTAPTAMGTPKPSTQAIDHPITVSRTGGLAGVQDTWTVDANGLWQTTSRDQAARSGRLTSDQGAQLNTLLSDPALLTDLSQPGSATCSDAFHYSMSMGTRRYEMTGCGENRPTFDKLMLVLRNSTQ